MNIEQERAAFERHWRDFYQIGTKLDRINGRYHSMAVQCAWEAWQAGRAALQSQDMKPVIEALEAAQNNECGPHRPFGSSDPDSDDYDHDAFMWDYYQKAIDHARRFEGELK